MRRLIEPVLFTHNMGFQVRSVVIDIKIHADNGIGGTLKLIVEETDHLFGRRRQEGGHWLVVGTIFIGEHRSSVDHQGGCIEVAVLIV